MAVWDNIVAGTPSTVISTAKPRIVIGIPHMETTTFQYAMRMLVPLFGVQVDWCDKTQQMARGIPQNLARDQIVEGALLDPLVTHILWVDSDNVCVTPNNPNDALKILLQCNQPIVSGLYRAKQKEGFNYAAWIDVHKVDQSYPKDKKGYVPIQSYTGNFFPVDVIGMGFSLVKREVYEKIQKPWHPWTSPSPSEDFNFCEKAKEAGFLTYIMADVRLSHIGTLNVYPDLKDGKPDISVLDV
jgi:hypothetical protein